MCVCVCVSVSQCVYWLVAPKLTTPSMCVSGVEVRHEKRITQHTENREPYTAHEECVFKGLSVILLTQEDTGSCVISKGSHSGHRKS